MILASEAVYSEKAHGVSGNAICVSNDASPIANCGEPAGTTGVLGLGKLMPSNRALITDSVISGMTCTNG